MDANVTMLNISQFLRARDVATSAATFVDTVRNVTVPRNVTSNAYEWRFILPPYILIFMLSISGNCMVIATLASNKRMRTVTNVYLMNLAISDFLLGVFCLPFTLVGQIYRRFLFGAALCKLIPFLQAVSVSVDVWTLVAISLERYFAICRPLKSRKWQTQCHAYKMIAMVWLLSIMLNSPILLASTLQPMKGNVSVSVDLWTLVALVGELLRDLSPPAVPQVADALPRLQDDRSIMLNSPIIIASTLQPMKGNAFKCREVWPSLELERTFNLGLDAALLLIPIFVMSFAYCLIVTKLWRGMRHEIQHNFNWQRQLSEKSTGKDTLIPTTGVVMSGHSTELCCKTNLLIKKKDLDPKLPREAKTGPCYMHTELDFRHAVRSTHTDKSIEAKRKVIRMLFVIILEFFVCWTPLHVINTIYLFYPEELYQYIGSKGIICLQLLAYCSSFSNPITYCFMNRKFRQAFICLIKNCKLFGGCFPEQSECKQVTPQPSSQDATACVIRGSQTARTELDGLEGEECV